MESLFERPAFRSQLKWCWAAEQGIPIRTPSLPISAPEVTGWNLRPISLQRARLGWSLATLAAAVGGHLYIEAPREQPSGKRVLGDLLRGGDLAEEVDLAPFRVRVRVRVRE